MDATTSVALQTSLYVGVIPAFAGFLAAFLGTRNDVAVAPRTLFFVLAPATLVSRMGINGTWTAFTNEATYWVWAGALGALFVVVPAQVRRRRLLFALVVGAAALVMAWPLSASSWTTVVVVAAAVLACGALAFPGDNDAAGGFAIIGSLSLLIGAAAALTAAFGSLRFAQLIGAFAVVGGAASVYLLLRARDRSVPALGVMLLAFGLLALSMSYAFVDVSLKLVLPLAAFFVVIPRVGELTTANRRTATVLGLTVLALCVAGATGYALYEPDPYAAYGGY